MYKAKMSPVAREDLFNILDYIENQLDAPVAAADFYEIFEKCVDNLESNPYIYEVCRAEHLKKRGYRRAIVKNYLVLYTVNEDKKIVMIHHVVFGARDYENQL
ncbi:MAG: type II toxin-antitoxin system RelE/ParE family toxin [Oscillospiraceae bacterium]|nr:type II toxin-antitoxin system RelE/ParE family toxin [Oscillospiraceae bacterium]